MPKSNRNKNAASAKLNPTQFLRQVKQRRWVMVVVLLVAGLAGIVADKQGWLLKDGGDLSRYDAKTFRVVKVIDGDTIDIDLPDGKYPTTRIRLWGIDTPEKANQQKQLAAQPFANDATEFTQKLCRDQQVTLQLESHRLRGNYGRLLAYVELPDGSMLNEQLLAAGLARADQRWGHRHSERFTFIEKQARHDKVGLWSK